MNCTECATEIEGAPWSEPGCDCPLCPNCYWQTRHAGQGPGCKVRGPGCGGFAAARASGAAGTLEPEGKAPPAPRCRGELPSPGGYGEFADEAPPVPEPRPQGTGAGYRRMALGADGLTDRQRQVLELVRRRLRATGLSPTVREIIAELGVSSPSTVQRHLGALIRKGALARSGRGARLLYLVGAKECCRCGAAPERVVLDDLGRAWCPVCASDQLAKVA